MLDNLDLSAVDVALFAGDVASLRGRGPWHIYDQMKWRNKTFFDFCSSFPKTKILFIPGNHDFFPLIKQKFSNNLFGHDIELKLAPNTQMLLDSEDTLDIDGEKLRVYGTPWVPIISYSWAFEAEHDVLKKNFSRIPDGLDILLTHTPPRFNYVDVSLDHGQDSQAFGSYELAEEIFMKKPKICFCGHIHSGDHSMNKLGDTEVYNVSRVNENYRIAYDSLILEL